MTIFDFFANPARFEKLSRVLSPWLLGGALVLAAIGLPIALVFSPEDYQQGHSVRIMYIHVPAAWMATMGYVFLAAMSAIAFIWRHSVADAAARASATIGLALTGLALVTGALWGKPTWGAWWVWDARLTSVLVLFFIYLGYMAIWDAVSDPAKAAKFARIVALLGFVNIPIIKFSVDRWNTLHQPASLIRADGPTISGEILTPLLIMMGSYALFFAWSVFAGTEAIILNTRHKRRMAQANAARTIQTRQQRGSTDKGSANKTTAQSGEPS